MEEKYSPEILFEDNHLIVVNKKASEIVHSDKTGDVSLEEKIKNFIKIRDQKQGGVYLGLVHRLDRPTSGALIFAKTSKAAGRLGEMFKTKKIQKTYWALVKNKPEKLEDTLKNYLLKNPKNNKATVYNRPTEGAKEAILHYKLIESLDNYHLLEIELETGRHHQIRAQLAYMGCPIKGDIKYGFDRTNSDASIHLHARKIEFSHPVSQENIVILAPTNPKDKLWASIKS